MAAADGHVRASDAERDRVIEVLHRHAADGRLTMTEFEERVGEAYAAVTRADLEPVLRDLPALPTLASPPSGPRRPRRRLSDAVDGRMIGVAVVMATLVVLAVTDAWWMWWIVFPLMGIFGKHRSGGGWCSGGRHTRDDAGRAHGRTGHDADRETITV
ncbi:MAG TPA: DUF1707 domain-containing protein [Euzebyales bacterium]